MRGIKLKECLQLGFRSVVVITLASHARGRGFEPRRNLHVLGSYIIHSAVYGNIVVLY